MPVAAILLAAGASRRLGQPKQLLVHERETLLGRAVRLAGESGAAPVFVVLGGHFERICAAVSFGSASPVFNEQWEKGIASSIHAGLHAMDIGAPNAAGALILSCDQPRLTGEHLRALIETFTAQPEPAIVASAYAGVHGIPAVFPRAVFDDLLGLQGDRGARALLVNPPCPVIGVPFAGGEVDIDVPEDLARLE
jgi:molybdenum cofactor cytidylyltransferase